jgi:hypothetical protein
MHGMQEVVGSIPTSSTKASLAAQAKNETTFGLSFLLGHQTRVRAFYLAFPKVGHEPTTFEA